MLSRQRAGRGAGEARSFLSLLHLPAFPRNHFTVWGIFLPQTLLPPGPSLQEEFPALSCFFLSLFHPRPVALPCISRSSAPAALLLAHPPVEVLGGGKGCAETRPLLLLHACRSAGSRRVPAGRGLNSNRVAECPEIRRTNAGGGSSVLSLAGSKGHQGHQGLAGSFQAALPSASGRTLAAVA